ncbi:uncharacterized protein EDB91DRAFT_1332727 [Suillus paluster]|uniref:uncharacterized protein n=1 Tax=Suillus paluster TaxID=48578 RepID=UPI001B85F211|nr:uncharacterized protein EDB91DRAFT_1077754 [Suillus paluster]XP_041183620.1 uncharacterized protein EDB91DRAFT_1332727 [Suillus paluster]KAG1752322.1 hypothetical protein EDB91DRAFT_1077754 [Suillus paluster]KAG1754909.1 hypothetical protein EDB91DRAFT_1332727 [Suillus paluster]
MKGSISANQVESKGKKNAPKPPALAAKPRLVDESEKRRRKAASIGVKKMFALGGSLMCAYSSRKASLLDSFNLTAALRGVSRSAQQLSAALITEPGPMLTRAELDTLGHQ